MHLDAIIPHLCGVALVILTVGVLLRAFRQPHVVAYIIAMTLLLGPLWISLIGKLTSRHSC